MYKNLVKPVFDRSLALLLIILSSPIILILVLLLFFANQGKVFFFQKRNGFSQKEFTVIKFKTMNDKVDSEGRLLPDSMRLTPVGSFVRKTSLDELPQLINILKGDMSFIGPRPLLLRYLPYFTERECIRFTVKPGITGLAQVSGRNLLHWDKRLALDVEYAQDVNFVQDFKIVIQTIKNILLKKDIVVDPESVMLNFDDERKLHNRQS